jgi:hypothetical protein
MNYTIRNKEITEIILYFVVMEGHLHFSRPHESHSKTGLEKIVTEYREVAFGVGSRRTSDS